MFCLTMSAELMESQFVRRPSVRAAIISEPNARISFKNLVVASPESYARDFFEFKKKNI